MCASLLKFSGFLLVLFSFACSDSVQHVSKGTPDSPISGTLKTILQDSSDSPQDKLYLTCSIREFYSLRNYQPVWFKNGNLLSSGDSLIAIIGRASYLGLIPEDYHNSAIDNLVLGVSRNSPSDSAKARLELYLSDALFLMAMHLRDGRTEGHELVWKSVTEMDSLLYEPLIAAVSRNNVGDVLRSFEPARLHYAILKAELKGKLDSIYSVTSDSLTLQRLESEAKILSINMERWRWEAQDSVSRYLMVNIPSYRLEIRDGETVQFESAIVVGAPWSPTPLLDASLINLIVYPTWNVPRSIATRELLPKIKNDSTYLAAHNYKVLDIKGGEVNPDSVTWEKHHTNHFPFMLQQQAGAFNALGLVKFTFANDFNIYLHDTNARKFFEYPKRALSHGCIRVERALELADFLVREENPYCTPAELRFFFDQGKQRQINFNPLALKIRYFTSEPAADGRVLFHDDIYGYDRPLIELIYCRHPAKSASAWLAINRVKQSGQTDACL